MKNFDFTQLAGPLGPRIEQGLHSYLYFGGTAYLGIPANPQFLNYYTEGIRVFGLNNGTSRTNNIQLGIYKEAEKAAALRFGAESALVSSSGYLAAQMAVRCFADWGEVLYAPGTHPALWLNGNPQTPGSFKDWAQQALEEINSSKKKRWVLISNSMNNLFPECFDFSFLEEVDPDKEVLLIADDSHGIGILQDGKGCYTDLPQRKNIHRIVVASMAKALGIDAGVILGPEELIRQLKQRNEFTGGSPPSAAGLFAFMQSESLYREQRLRLGELTAYFTAGLKDLDIKFASTDGFPVYLSAQQDLGVGLVKKGILISSFAYPDQFGTILDRIVLCSWHSEKDLEILLQMLKDYH